MRSVRASRRKRWCGRSAGCMRTFQPSGSFCADSSASKKWDVASPTSEPNSALHSSSVSLTVNAIGSDSSWLRSIDHWVERPERTARSLRSYSTKPV